MFKRIIGRMYILLHPKIAATILKGILTLILSVGIIVNVHSYHLREIFKEQQSGRSYDDIARIVNPNQYAFVSLQPYPGQPFWPQG